MPPCSRRTAARPQQRTSARGRTRSCAARTSSRASWRAPTTARTSSCTSASMNGATAARAPAATRTAGW
eukprot:945606-Prymnesium_polylepis.1